MKRNARRSTALGLAALGAGLVVVPLLSVVRTPLVRESSGGFALRDPTAGPHAAPLRAPVAPEPRPDPEVRRGRSESLTPSQPSTLEGRVIDATSGTAVGAFRVLHARANQRARIEGALAEPSRARLRVTPDGGFLLEGLPPGRYDLLVDARPSGYEPRVLAELSLPLESALVVRVERGPHVHGHVRTADGRPLGDRVVELVGPLGGPGDPPLRTSSTDEEGRYLFSGLGPGRYRIAAPVELGTSGTPAASGSELSILDRNGVEHDLVLALPGALRVSVEDPHGVPLERPTLVAARSGEFRRARPRGLEGSGGLFLDGLAPDRYALEVRHEGFRPGHSTVSVGAGTPTELRVVLEPDPRRLPGR